MVFTIIQHLGNLKKGVSLTQNWLLKFYHGIELLNLPGRHLIIQM